MKYFSLEAKITFCLSSNSSVPQKAISSTHSSTIIGQSLPLTTFPINQAAQSKISYKAIDLNRITLCSFIQNSLEASEKHKHSVRPQSNVSTSLEHFKLSRINLTKFIPTNPSPSKRSVTPTIIVLVFKPTKPHLNPSLSTMDQLKVSPIFGWL